MQLTQEDLKQIEQWLIENSIKDSQFEQLDNPINNDTVVIVHNNLNYKIPISSLIKIGIENTKFQDLPTQNKTIIDSIKELVITSGQFPEAPIDGEIYGREDGEWKNIKDLDIFIDLKNKVNQLLKENLDCKLTVTPSIIFAGNNTLVTLQANSNAVCDTIEIKNNNSSLINKSNEDDIIYVTRINDTTTFNAEFNYLNTIKKVKTTVTAVNPIFYGSSLESNYLIRDLIKYSTPVISPNREYKNINVKQNGDAVYFLVPSSMTINKATLNGYGFPIHLEKTEMIEIQQDTEKVLCEYKVYKSDNVYEKCTLNIEIL